MQGVQHQVEEGCHTSRELRRCLQGTIWLGVAPLLLQIAGFGCDSNMRCESEITIRGDLKAWGIERCDVSIIIVGM